MTRRPKHADVDKPRASMKRHLRRWLRHLLRRETKQEIQESYSC
jgi:hypothetical protein